MHKLSNRLRSSDGFAMVIALVVVVIVLALAAALISSSVTTSTHADQEFGRSSALAAADAGAEAAIHRLSNEAEETAAQEAKCFTTEFVAATAGVCPLSAQETEANGTTFRYAVSAVMSEGENPCTGLWLVAPSSEATVTQRCITAIGTAKDGITARVQERVADIKEAAIFPVNGMFSYGELKINNELKMNGGELATTNIINVNNKVESTLPVAAKYGVSAIKESNCPKCTFSKLTAAELAVAPWKLPEPSAKPYEEAEKANSNGSMTIVGGGGTLNAKRELSANGVVTIKLPAGTYDLCSVSLNNEAVIEYTPPVTIYVDDNYRTGSTCATGTGGMNLNNKVNWLDLATTKNANDLRIFMWGKPKEIGKAVELNFNNANGGPFYGEIYAPYVYINMNNTVNMVGSVVGGIINQNNKLELNAKRGAGEEGLTGASFYPTAYHQCPPSYTGSNPAVGCY
jgi:Tfp pilus assembly protein PilX